MGARFKTVRRRNHTWRITLLCVACAALLLVLTRTGSPSSGGGLSGNSGSDSSGSSSDSDSISAGGSGSSRSAELPAKTEELREAQQPTGGSTGGAATGAASLGSESRTVQDDDAAAPVDDLPQEAAVASEETAALVIREDTARQDLSGTALPEGARRIGSYVEVIDGRNVTKNLLDEPIPDDCFVERNADYDGYALTWGLTWKLASAAQCCQACKDFKPTPDGNRRCNVWVFCPDPSGECWSPDIWTHTSGECWLKFQEDWDGNTDRSATNLVVNSRGEYPPAFREEHKTAPLMVPWTGGLIPP